MLIKQVCNIKVPVLNLYMHHPYTAKCNNHSMASIFDGCKTCICSGIHINFLILNNLYTVRADNNQEQSIILGMADEASKREIWQEKDKMNNSYNTSHLGMSAGEMILAVWNVQIDAF